MTQDIDLLDDDIELNFEVSIKAGTGSTIEREINQLAAVGKKIRLLLEPDESSSQEEQ